MEELRKHRLREIPAVNEITGHPALAELSFPQVQITKAAQEALISLRTSLLTSQDREFLARPIELDALAKQVETRLERVFSNSLRRVINATGVVLHTNCGRSVLPPGILHFVTQIACGYSNLELNLATGDRGSRYTHVEELLCELTGAEAAMVVNNNAAAVLLVMKVLAESKQVIVSRGELVEVGGAFRIPEVLKAGGAELVEVGATNKTRLQDYAAAVTGNTAILLKVHTSNFRIIGFCEEVSSGELVGLGKTLGIPVVEDLGSGTLVDLSRWGIPYEPTVQQVVKSGVDLVTFSGDKLFGGPQAGIIVGKREYIELLKGSQLTRALRIDKLTLAALEGTLRMYLEERTEEIPTLQMLSLSLEELQKRARALAGLLKDSCGKFIEVQVEEGFSQAGGGSLPTANVATYLVSAAPCSGSVNELELFLRSGDPPVLARIQRDKLLLDVRTLLPGEDTILADQFKNWVQTNH